MKPPRRGKHAITPPLPPGAISESRHDVAPPRIPNADKALSDYLPAAIGTAICCLTLILLIIALNLPVSTNDEQTSGNLGTTSESANASSSTGEDGAKSGPGSDSELEADSNSGSNAGDGSDASVSASATGSEAVPKPSENGDEQGGSASQEAALEEPAGDANEVADQSTKRKIATFHIPSQPAGGLPWTGSAAGGKSDFFGAEAVGKRFVYVVDASGSMNGSPFQDACAELIRSIKALSAKQSYLVIFFNDGTFEAPRRAGRRLWQANAKNAEAIQGWIGQMIPAGGTYPLDALLAAIDVRPDAIYFLTDGQFDPTVVNAVVDANRKEIPIHTIAFGSGAAVNLLEELAQRTGGGFRSVGP